MGQANLDGCHIMINATCTIVNVYSNVHAPHAVWPTYIASAISYPIVITLPYNNNNVATCKSAPC